MENIIQWVAWIFLFLERKLFNNVFVNVVQMIMYKIRCKNDPSKFMTGTPQYHSYNSIGRIFQTIGKLRSFLTLILNSHYMADEVSDWEIVEFEMVVKDVKGVHEVITTNKLKELIMK